MRFGLVHRIMTDALAALGVLALVASGQFSRPFNIGVTICLLLAVSMREAWRQEAANRHVDTIGVIALVTGQLGRAVFANASVLELLIEFAVGLQIIRVATRKGAAHDQQVIVLALLHLIAGTVVGGGLGYGLCFFGLLVVTPGALVLSHLRREVEGNYRQGARDRTGLPVDVPRILRSKRVMGRQFIAVTCMLAVPILLFTISLFIVFPRVGLSLLLLTRPKGGRMIGFSGKVDLGQIGTLRSDPTIALRISLPPERKDRPARLIMHLRGTALDHYDGRTWTQSHKRSRSIANGGDLVALHPNPKSGRRWRIELEPIEPPVLFLPPTTMGFRLARTASVGPGVNVHVLRSPEGEFRYQPATERGIRYELFLFPKGAKNNVSFTRLGRGNRQRHLQLPKNLAERIGALAREWTKGVAGDLRRAKVIERHLRHDFRYDLSSPSGKHDQPLDHFLFESKRGHCEYFSTAMAVMLRTLGIPSRNVTGFVGGSYNRYGEFYAVRQGDAHSWVEGYVKRTGWVTFDPTPPGAAIPQSEIDGMLASMRDFFEAVSQRWNRHVLGYDLRQQVGLFESLNGRYGLTDSLLRRPRWRTLLAAAGLLLALACGYWLYRRRKRKLAAPGETQEQPSKDALLATKLYETLDRAMAAIGVARSASIPPMLHATTLAQIEHPIGLEVLALTERYLEARFGELPLDGDGRRDFERRVRRIKEAPRGSAREEGSADRAQGPPSADPPPQSGNRTSERPADSNGSRSPEQLT